MDELKQLTQQFLNIDINTAQLAAFNQYYELLHIWNKKYNLTSITTRKDILVKHFIDSLTCLSVLPEKGSFRLIDIGTGAGFPGIPLILLNPEISLTLVESVKKKADFCEIVIKELGLSDVQILHARAEDIGRNPAYRETYDWSVARAVADLSVLAEYLLPLTIVGGYALAMKSANFNEELHLAKPAISALGGEIDRIDLISLPENYGERSLILIKKIKPTPEKWPRKAGLPTKKPLL